MESLREQAKRLKEDKKYSEAINIYTQLYTPESDKWIAWEYSYCLKQLNMIDQAIIVCKKTYSNDKSFKYNNDLLAWLLYEKYFKHLKEEYTSDEIKKYMT